LSFFGYLKAYLTHPRRIITRPFPKQFGWITFILGLSGILKGHFFTEGLLDKASFMILGLFYLLFGLIIIGAKSLPKGFDAFYDDK
jgi:hypothetical protein